MNTRILASALATASLTALLPAQVGDPMPPAKFEAFGNSEAGSLDDFQGRLVLLEVFAYW